MWLITPIGFFSIVQKPSDKSSGTLTVRARVRSDLDALKQHYLPGLDDIKESADTDYRFRATAPRGEVSAALAELAADIDYSNFKAEVAKKQGYKRSSLYHEVWKTLYQLQTEPVFAEIAAVADSFGGVVISGGSKVLLREPTKHHGGYVWTFAKTEAKPGESSRDAAVRAVREKTGYDAEIRISLPGLFKGSSSSTIYYVMDAKHPPAKPNWQTSSLRWVSFDEARELIRQSPNADGRDRDLAILDAVEKAAAAIPYKEHARVQPEDWSDLREMHERHTVLYPKLRYTREEMDKIQRGFYPTVMEQKWFLYFTGERLRMHRSWTGIMIFDIGFAFDSEGGAYVTEAVVNRNPDEYSNNDDDEDLTLLEDIIRYHLLEPLEEPEVDGMVKALMQATKPKYLGSPEVVTALIKEVFDVSVRAMADEATEDDFVAAAGRVIAAFTDDNAGYTRMPGWHSAEEMGAYIKKYLIGSPGGAGEGNLAAILEKGVAALFLTLQEMLVGFMKDPVANWEEHALVQLNSLHQFVVAVLLGTNTVTYGEKTLQDFKWQMVLTTSDHDKQVILQVGSEGGKLSLLGMQSNSAWQFCLDTDESTLIDLIDDEDAVDEVEEGEIEKSPWVPTWRGALKRLDAYPWTKLYPLVVHREFRDRVFKALQAREKKGSVIDWDTWNDVLKKET